MTLHEGLGELKNCPLLYTAYSCQKCKEQLDFLSGTKCDCHKKHKYGAMRIFVNGIRFSSLAEGRRYSQLSFLQSKGLIVKLELQPKFPIKGPDGKTIFNYIADFKFTVMVTKNIALPQVFHGVGPEIVEDVKGSETPVFRLKLKMIRAFYPNLNLVLIGKRKKANFQLRKTYRKKRK